MMVPETPQVRDAIAHIKSAGVYVVALASGAQVADRTDVSVLLVDAADPHAVVDKLKTLDLSELDGVA